jgi:hypothetical protein
MRNSSTKQYIYSTLGLHPAVPDESVAEETEEIPYVTLMLEGTETKRAVRITLRVEKLFRQFQTDSLPVLLDNFDSIGELGSSTEVYRYMYCIDRMTAIPVLSQASGAAQAIVLSR